MQALVLQIVLTHDDMLVGVVDQAAMLFMEEHQQRRGDTLDVRQVDMDEHEDDEDVHQEVVNDAHRHRAANELGTGCEERQVHRGSPQAQAGVEHNDDQNRNEQVAELLRNAKLSSQRMILFQEQVVLDPSASLMTIVFLGQPRLVVLDLLAGAARRSRLHEESQDNADNAVNEQHEAAEDMHAASDAHEIRPEREVDAETRDDQADHCNEVDPVSNHERQRMCFFVVSEMRHLTSPPKGS